MKSKNQNIRNSISGVRSFAKEEKKKGRLVFMRMTIVLLAMLLLVAPAMAAVTVTCVDDGTGNGVAEVYYDARGEVELIRAFGLDLVADTANIVSVTSVNSDYYIYPGTIVITDGNVTAWGTPVAPANDPGAGTGLGTGNATVEMGSLYAAGDGNLTPDPCGLLCKVTVSADCNLTISTNITRGGVVMEDTATPSVGPSTCALDVNDCYGPGDPNYGDWVTLGRPECWCYPKQCHGDATGYGYGRNLYHASTPDLTVLKDAWNKDAPNTVGHISVVDVNKPTEWACADFDRMEYGRNKYRVSTPDLTILKAYWNDVPVAPPANCPPGNRLPPNF